MVKMELTDATWHMVKNTAKVTGFLGGGSKGRPVPITEREAESIFAQVREGIDHPKSQIRFEIGENVKIIEGPFDSFVGLVEQVDEEKSRVKVSVSIFGRATPVDLEFSQVEKVA
jgi:transcriptional antiterminator NusG